MRRAINTSQGIPCQQQGNEFAEHLIQAETKTHTSLDASTRDKSNPSVI